MVIPTVACSNIDKKFVSVILKDVSKDLAKHHFMILKMLKEDGDNKKIMLREIVDKLGIKLSGFLYRIKTQDLLFEYPRYK